jgi:uncharacterized protein
MDTLPEALICKRDRLLAVLGRMESCLVAFSGGLDSTVLAQAAHLALGSRAVAVTGVSASLAPGELEECITLARQIGIRHEVLETAELEAPGYQANAGNRCYFCKAELFTKLSAYARDHAIGVICDGTNLDDRQEHRPGRQAGRERNIASPLADCELTKAEIRQLAAHWGLPNSSKPATPCLSSRIAYGERVTPERLAMIGQAEQYLRARGFRTLRVRYHKDDLARIEVSAADLPRLAEVSLRTELVAYLKSIGFKYVSLDLEGFRSGSLNAVLPVESLFTNSRQ